MSAISVYGDIHSRINDAVESHAGRSASVTTGRTASGWYVMSALASRSNGDLIRVVITLDGERLDKETGRIADSLHAALISIPESERVAYASAWRDVFAPSNDVIK